MTLRRASAKDKVGPNGERGNPPPAGHLTHPRKWVSSAHAANSRYFSRLVQSPGRLCEVQATHPRLLVKCYTYSRCPTVVAYL